MLVINNLCSFNTTSSNFRENKNKTQRLCINSQSYVPTPSFSGSNNRIIDKLFKIFNHPPKSPLEKAIMFMDKGNKATFLEQAGKMYWKAMDTLSKNWATLDIIGHKQYVNASFALAACEASEHTGVALNRHKALFSNLIEMKSPLAKDKKTIGEICSKVFSLGNLAIERNSYKNAKDCYEFAKYISEYLQENKIARLIYDGEDATVILNRKLNKLKELKSALNELES